MQLRLGETRAIRHPNSLFPISYSSKQREQQLQLLKGCVAGHKHPEAGVKEAAPKTMRAAWACCGGIVATRGEGRGDWYSPARCRLVTLSAVSSRWVGEGTLWMEVSERVQSEASVPVSADASSLDALVVLLLSAAELAAPDWVLGGVLRKCITARTCLGVKLK